MRLKITPKVRNELKKKGVQVVYFFGSRARGEAGPLSDYDFACLVDPLKRDVFSVRLELVGDFSRLVGKDNVDVVLLDEPKVKSVFKYRVIKEGIILYNVNEKRRSDFEYQTMRQYLDRKFYYDRHTSMALEQFSRSGLK